MPACARLGDNFADGDIVAEGSGTVFVNSIPMTFLTASTTGEGCFPPVIIIQGSGSVFIENKAVSRLGDLKMVHSCPDHGSHDSIIATASGDVFVG